MIPVCVEWSDEYEEWCVYSIGNRKAPIVRFSTKAEARAFASDMVSMAFNRERAVQW